MIISMTKEKLYLFIKETFDKYSSNISLVEVLNVKKELNEKIFSIYLKVKVNDNDTEEVFQDYIKNRNNRIYKKNFINFFNIIIKIPFNFIYQNKKGIYYISDKNIDYIFKKKIFEFELNGIDNEIYDFDLNSFYPSIFSKHPVTTQFPAPPIFSVSSNINQQNKISLNLNEKVQNNFLDNLINSCIKGTGIPSELLGIKSNTLNTNMKIKMNKKGKN